MKFKAKLFQKPEHTFASASEPPPGDFEAIIIRKGEEVNLTNQVRMELIKLADCLQEAKQILERILGK